MAGFVLCFCSFEPMILGLHVHKTVIKSELLFKTKQHEVTVHLTCIKKYPV